MIQLKKYQKNVGEKLSTPKKIIKKQKSQKNSKNIKTTKNSIIGNSKESVKLKSTVQSRQLRLLHVNAADMKHKATDLKNKIKYFGSSIISVQETHFRSKGRFKLDNFVAFESIRKNKEKGGTMLLIHGDLKPVLIKEYNETFELIVVEINTQNNPIRVITGYGPQENWKESEKMPFWLAVEEEIASAEINERPVIIQMDANAKLGPQYVKHDPKEMSVNGRILSGIIERHALSVINGLEVKCTETITRERNTKENIERSVIDFIIVSSDLVKSVVNMQIDEGRQHVLTKFIKKKNKTVEISESDHNTITAVMDVEWKESNKLSCVEVFKFNDEEGLKTFQNLTTTTNHLSKIFDPDKSLNTQTKKFIKILKGFVNQCFTKVKISNKPDNELDNLYDKRRYLRSQKTAQSKTELQKVETELAEKYSDKMYDNIKEELKNIDGEDGGFN